MHRTSLFSVFGIVSVFAERYNVYKLLIFPNLFKVMIGKQEQLREFVSPFVSAWCSLKGSTYLNKATDLFKYV